MQQDVRKKIEDYFQMIGINPVDLLEYFSEISQLEDEQHIQIHTSASLEVAIEDEVARTLKTLGMPFVSGYAYIRKSIILCVGSWHYIEKITKSLYPKIAEDFCTTPSRVERAMRNAIERSYNHSPNTFEEYFGNSIRSITGRPTNREFIAHIADNIRRQFHLN